MPTNSTSRDSPIGLINSRALVWEAENPKTQLHLYALADAGQDKSTWSRLKQHGSQTLSLLNTQGSAADAFSPHLVSLGSATAPSAPVLTLLCAQHPTTAFTVFCSPLSTGELHQHLTRFVEIKLAGNMDMLLAYWDPAILGTLVGQKSDDSLHVPGPVLDQEQLQAFLSPVVAWWYCDRESRWHQIDPPHVAAAAGDGKPFTLTQAQEDMLVEASVPDQVLYHLELDQPNLFDDTKSHAMRYGFVKIVLGSARQLGLTGMRDLVNFTALCLIYRRRMQTDPDIARLLDQVQTKVLTLDQALPLMPE